MVYSVWSFICPFPSHCSRLCPIMCMQVSRVLANHGFKDGGCDGNLKCRICSVTEPISSSSDAQDWFRNETVIGKLDSWNVLIQLPNIRSCDWKVVVIQNKVFSLHTVCYQLHMLYLAFGGWVRVFLPWPCHKIERLCNRSVKDGRRVIESVMQVEEVWLFQALSQEPVQKWLTGTW